MNTENTARKNTTRYYIQRYGIWIAAALLTCVLPLIFRSGFALSMLSQMGIAIIFALSYNMLLGQGGMLSFGHAVFYGLGGFISIHALNIVMDGELPVPVELLPLVGGIGGFLFGIVFGWISTKRSGTTFALISLGIGELIAASSLMLPSFFGGEEGISGDRMLEVTLTGFEFGKQIEVYYLIGFLDAGMHLSDVSIDPDPAGACGQCRAGQP